mmetsp:Transcript_74162/g.226883  ORF Transcript_74162/g.226883 Transcript_74162/m.226883 type:complete len:233 (-) Transcript_74162:801-1499(-)
MRPPHVAIDMGGNEDQLSPSCQQRRDEDANTEERQGGPCASRSRATSAALAELHGGRAIHRQDAKHERDAEYIVRHLVIQREVHSAAELRAEERHSRQQLPHHPPIRYDGPLPHKAVHGGGFDGRADCGVELVQIAVEHVLDAVTYECPVRIERNRRAAHVKALELLLELRKQSGERAARVCLQGEHWHSCQHSGHVRAQQSREPWQEEKPTQTCCVPVHLPQRQKSIHIHR